MELQYFIWIAGICYSFCPSSKCGCHHRKRRLYKLTRTGGVAFDATNNCWVFLGHLPTPATHAAQNGIVMKELGDFALSSYPYQQWCTWLVDGKVCGAPIVKLKQLRKGHFATLNLCKKHRAANYRKKASNYYAKNKAKVLSKRKLEYARRKQLRTPPVLPNV